MVSILYYYGVMQWFVRKVGWILEELVGTTAAESINCAANIFLGQVGYTYLLQNNTRSCLRNCHGHFFFSSMQNQV